MTACAPTLRKTEPAAVTMRVKDIATAVSMLNLKTKSNVNYLWQNANDKELA